LGLDLDVLEFQGAELLERNYHWQIGKYFNGLRRFTNSPAELGFKSPDNQDLKEVAYNNKKPSNKHESKGQ